MTTAEKVNPTGAQLAESQWLLARAPQSLNIRGCWVSASAIDQIVASFSPARGWAAARIDRRSS